MEHSFVDDSAAAIDPEAIAQAEDDDDEAEAEAAEDGPSEPAAKKPRPGGHGRRKIEIEYIEDKIRRHITFSKRKAGISKKAYELSRLTGAQVLLLISSERGQIYSFATPKLQPILVNESSKALIEQCLNAPDPTPQLQIGVAPQAPEPAPQPSAADLNALVPAGLQGTNLASLQQLQQQLQGLQGLQNLGGLAGGLGGLQQLQQLQQLQGLQGLQGLQSLPANMAAMPGVAGLAGMAGLAGLGGGLGGLDPNLLQQAGLAGGLTPENLAMAAQLGAAGVVDTSQGMPAATSSSAAE